MLSEFYPGFYMPNKNQYEILSEVVQNCWLYKSPLSYTHLVIQHMPAFRANNTCLEYNKW